MPPDDNGNTLPHDHHSLKCGGGIGGSCKQLHSGKNSREHVSLSEQIQVSHDDDDDDDDDNDGDDDDDGGGDDDDDDDNDDGDDEPMIIGMMVMAVVTVMLARMVMDARGSLGRQQW